MNYSSEILEIIDETPKVKLFRVKRDSLFSFIEGQFAMLSVEGFTDKNGIVVKRSYSMSSSSLDREYIEFCVTRAENGFFSVKMHELQVGDKVNVNGPFGVFRISKPAPDNTTFVAGGSGIAPLRAMIRTMFLSAEIPKGVKLFYGFRSPSDFIYRDEINDYASQGWLSLSTTIDKPAEGWDGDVGFVTGILPMHSNYEKSDVYVCGPPPMVNATLRLLPQLGFDEKRIYREQW